MDRKDIENLLKKMKKFLLLKQLLFFCLIGTLLVSMLEFMAFFLGKDKTGWTLWQITIGLTMVFFFLDFLIRRVLNDIKREIFKIKRGD